MRKMKHKLDRWVGKWMGGEMDRQTIQGFLSLKQVLWVTAIEEGTFWDEHWVLYGNHFDNKFHIKKKKFCMFHRGVCEALLCGRRE